MTTKPFFALVLALAACMGSSEDATEDSGKSQDTAQDSGQAEDTAEDSGEADDVFMLTEGVWEGTYSLLENECGAEPSSGDFALTVSNLNGNTFTLASEPFEYSCSIEGVSAACDPYVYDETIGDSFSVLSTAIMGFTLESENRMSGLSLIEYSCVGEGCEEATGQPEGVFCTVDVPFEATLSD